MNCLTAINHHMLNKASINPGREAFWEIWEHCHTSHLIESNDDFLRSVWKVIWDDPYPFAPLSSIEDITKLNEELEENAIDEVDPDTPGTEQEAWRNVHQAFRRQEFDGTLVSGSGLPMDDQDYSQNCAYEPSETNDEEAVPKRLLRSSTPSQATHDEDHDVQMTGQGEVEVSNYIEADGYNEMEAAESGSSDGESDMGVSNGHVSSGTHQVDPTRSLSVLGNIEPGTYLEFSALNTELRVFLLQQEGETKSKRTKEVSTAAELDDDMSSYGCYRRRVAEQLELSIPKHAKVEDVEAAVKEEYESTQNWRATEDGSRGSFKPSPQRDLSDEAMKRIDRHWGDRCLQCGKVHNEETCEDCTVCAAKSCTRRCLICQRRDHFTMHCSNNASCCYNCKVDNHHFIVCPQACSACGSTRHRAPFCPGPDAIPMKLRIVPRDISMAKRLALEKW